MGDVLFVELILRDLEIVSHLLVFVLQFSQLILEVDYLAFLLADLSLKLINLLGLRFALGGDILL